MSERGPGKAVGDTPTIGQNVHWNGVARRQYEPEGRDELVTAIAFAIADAKGVGPAELTRPLYGVIDVDGIEQAFFGSGTNAGSGNGTARVEFCYAEYLVNVGSDGWIRVYEPSEPGRE